MQENHKTAYLQSIYQELYHFEEKPMVLVRNTVTSQIGLKKRLTVYNERVYAWLAKHPSGHLCNVLDYWREGNNLIVVEELISGETLADLLDNNALNEQEKKDILLQILDGVFTLHHADPPIIHRDLKAENIMVTADHCAKIIDYNASKTKNNAEQRDTVLIGTEGHAAPEQYGFGASDERTDLYALGVLIREMFPDDQRMKAVADKACRMDPDERYHNIKEMKEALIGKRVKYINIPGFRSRNPVHMVAACAAYILIISMIFTMHFTSADGTPASAAENNINHFCMLAVFLCWLDLFTGWSGFYNHFRWIAGTDRVKKIIGMALASAVTLTAGVMVSALLTGLLH